MRELAIALDGARSSNSRVDHAAPSPAGCADSLDALARFEAARGYVAFNGGQQRGNHIAEEDVVKDVGDVERCALVPLPP